MDDFYRRIQEFNKQNGLPTDNAHKSSCLASLFADAVDKNFEGLSTKEIADIANDHWHMFQTRTADYHVKICDFTQTTSFISSGISVIHIIAKDMRFMMRSIRLVLKRSQVDLKHMMSISGCHVKRDKDGHLKNFNISDKQVNTEASYCIILELLDQGQKKLLTTMLDEMFSDLINVNTDWDKMKQKIDHVVHHIAKDKNLLRVEKTDLTKMALWIKDRFNLFGFRAFEYKAKADKYKRTPMAKYKLGVLKKAYKSSIRTYSSSELSCKSECHMYMTQTKATLQNDLYTIMISFVFEEKGQLYEYQFLGLFPTDVYDSDPLSLPWLKRKVDAVHTLAGSHMSQFRRKSINKIVRMLPRDELFLSSERDLYMLVMSIFSQQGRRAIEINIRNDRYSHFLSCFIMMPADSYTSKLQHSIEQFLSHKFCASDIMAQCYFKDFDELFIHYQILLTSKSVDINTPQLLDSIQELCNNWDDNLLLHSSRHFGQDKAKSLARKYIQIFSDRYKKLHTASESIDDISHLEMLSNDRPVIAKLLLDVDENLVFRVYHKRLPKLCYHLSEITEILQTMGISTFSENSHKLRLSDKETVFIRVLSIDQSEVDESLLLERHVVIEQLFERVFQSSLVSDRLNKLALLIGFDFQVIDLFRAYIAFVMQQGWHNYSIDAYHDALLQNNDIVDNMLHFFNMRFQIEKTDDEKIKQIDESINSKVDAVKSLTQDKILRSILHCLKHTVRTNFFIPGRSSVVLKFKAVSPSTLSFKPMYETFLHHHEFIGIHIRMAKRSRGGIRWSDQNEGLREEVLALTKAQSIKNSVIIPDGAKGGFFIKKDRPSKSMVLHCYRLFIDGLLSITDNIEQEVVKIPKHVKCYDDFDPYLVVAADKGTATYSDDANAIAKRYHFWLGDAFASGGEHGYNHKSMAVTAKTAWNSAKWHFKTLDYEKDKVITAVGIGDMSGDVFGNGLLLSDKIALIAAFNHRLIFIDPNPDTSLSFEERRRLFTKELDWDHYDTRILSAGGMIYSRADKKLQLSPEACAALGLGPIDSMEPNELIRVILKAPVDFIFNGGIGTYIKASTETNEQVGDKNNIPLRINATDIRAKVISEGGNLGMTQNARIEFNLSDGLCNADFIDNLGGVDCSDKEVNIKILFNGMIADKRMTVDERNKYLNLLKDDIVDMVVRDNEDQNTVISLIERRVKKNHTMFHGFQTYLSETKKLSLEANSFPNDKEITDRISRGKTFVRPEIALVVAHSKKLVKSELIESAIIDLPIAQNYLFKAFPKQLAEDFHEDIKQHYLKEDIIATMISNQFVLDTGVAYLFQLFDEFEKDADEVFQAYLLAREILNIDQLDHMIQSQKKHLSMDSFLYIKNKLTGLLRLSIRWILSSNSLAIIANDDCNKYKDIVTNIFKKLSSVQSYETIQYHQMKEQFSDSSIESSTIDQFYLYFSILNPVQIAISINRHHYAVDQYIFIYVELSRYIDSSILRFCIDDYTVSSSWELGVRSTLRGRLAAIYCDMTSRAMVFLDTAEMNHLNLIRYLLSDELLISKLNRWKNAVDDMHSKQNYTLSMLDGYVTKLSMIVQNTYVV